MLSLTVAEIIKSVRAIIDESDNADSIGDSLVDDMIKENITRAILKVHSSAEASLIEGISLPKSIASVEKPDDASGEIATLALPGDVATIQISFKNDVGTVKLPADFLRIVSFRMSDWKKSCTSVIEEDSTAYEMQQDPYCRGTQHNPVCALVRREDGYDLEVYGSTNTATVSKGIYIPLPEIKNDSIDVCTKLKDAVLYQIAGITMLSFGDQRAESLLQISKTFMS